MPNTKQIRNYIQTLEDYELMMRLTQRKLLPTNFDVSSEINAFKELAQKLDDDLPNYGLTRNLMRIRDGRVGVYQFPTEIEENLVIVMNYMPFFLENKEIEHKFDENIFEFSISKIFLYLTPSLGESTSECQLVLRKDMMKLFEMYGFDSRLGEIFAYLLPYLAIISKAKKIFNLWKIEGYSSKPISEQLSRDVRGYMGFEFSKRAKFMIHMMNMISGAVDNVKFLLEKKTSDDEFTDVIEETNTILLEVEYQMELEAKKDMNSEMNLLNGLELTEAIDEIRVMQNAILNQRNK